MRLVCAESVNINSFIAKLQGCQCDCLAVGAAPKRSMRTACEACARARDSTLPSARTLHTQHTTHKYAHLSRHRLLVMSATIIMITLPSATVTTYWKPCQGAVIGAEHAISAVAPPAKS